MSRETRRFEVMPERSRELVLQLLDSLGLDKHTAAEVVIEPWGVSVWVYLHDDFGHPYLDEATGRPAREHIHFPNDLVGETP